MVKVACGGLFINILGIFIIVLKEFERGSFLQTAHIVMHFQLELQFILVVSPMIVYHIGMILGTILYERVIFVPVQFANLLSRMDSSLLYYSCWERFFRFFGLSWLP